MNSELLLQARGLACRLPNGRRLFSGVHASVRAGELLAIEGENSAGKSTLIRCLLKLRAPSSGEVESRLRPEEIAYVPQLGNVQFFLPLLVKDVIAFDADAAGAADPSASQTNSIEKAAAELGLLSAKTLEQDWNTASGGERQRAMLTKAFLSRARLFVLDEPFNHLDRATRPLVLELIRRRLAAGAGAIVVSHDSIARDLPMATALSLSSAAAHASDPARPSDDGPASGGADD